MERLVPFCCVLVLPTSIPTMIQPICKPGRDDLPVLLVVDRVMMGLRLESVSPIALCSVGHTYRVAYYGPVTLAEVQAQD